MTPTLQARGLVKRFEGLIAVDHLDLEVEAGEIVSLIGPNGAGKTTAFNMLSGITAPDEGQVLVDGADTAGWPSWRVLRLGVARIFQNPRVFRRLTVLENVAVTTVGSSGIVRELRSLLSRDSRRRDRAVEVLDTVGLGAFKQELAGNLSYGHLRRLEMARALASGPQLMLLDEPSAGMTPKEADDLSSLIMTIREGGVAVLLIEHNMAMVSDISDRILVLNFGALIAAGTPVQVQNDPRVIEAYLGGVQPVA